MIKRRSILAGLLLSLIGQKHVNAGQKKIYNVGGTITVSNFKGFEQFLFNSLDTVIGVKVVFPATEHTTAGITATGDGNQFVAYFSGVGESEIVASEGFQYLHGDYVFDGFFIVKSGGMHQGIISLYLEKTDEAQVRLSNAKIVDISADRLNPKYKKKN